jgi:4-hydroxy-tetrahydrodipicolinate synthase
VRNGELEKAKKINDINTNLYRLMFVESNPIPVKWCLNKMGLIKKGIRLPLTWMDEKYDESLNHALIKIGVVNE